jgi:CHAT domain-containing protein
MRLLGRDGRCAAAALASIVLTAGLLRPSHVLAATPAICASPATTAVAAPAPDVADQLSTLAAQTEARIAAGRPPQGEAERSALAGTMTATPSATAPTASLAAYCTAYGELVRRGWIDGSTPADVALDAGFHDALLAGDKPVAALAAFRLSLAVASATEDADSEASRGGPSGAAPITDSALLHAATGPSACAALSSSDRDVRGDPSTPAVALACSAALSSSDGDGEDAAIADLVLARRFLAQAADSVDDSAALKARAAALAEAGLRIGLGRSREVVGRLADTALDAGVSDPAALQPALTWMAEAPASDPADRAYAAALQARLSLADGQPAAAVAAVQQAIVFESQRPAPLRLPDWYLLLSQADPAGRDRDVRAAYAALQSVRPLLPLRDPITGESTFELHMRAVFEAAVDLQLEGASDPTAIGAAQQIVEAYRQAELESYFGNECAPSRTPIQPSQLRGDEVLLYPVLLNDRVELLVADGHSGGAFTRLPANRAYNLQSVSALVATLRAAAIRNAPGGDGPPAWQASARALYDLLIAPIEGRLSPDTTLVVLPDGPLRLLPFGVLMDRQQHFLIQRTRLAMAPALAYSQPGADDQGRRATVAAGALGKSVTFDQITYPALAGGVAEAQAAAASVGAHDGYLIPDLTSPNLHSALASGRFTVLHLATHAAFNVSSGRSYIVTEDQLIPLATLRQMIEGADQRGVQIDLIVLSACETAVGNDEASMGLAGAAIEAGAHSAVASLWRVNDASTAQLMRAFYAAYRSGDSKAASLRAAQLALIGDARYHDPYYWGAFTLIGGWR